MALVLMLANMFYSRKLNGFIALKSGVWRNANIEAAFIQSLSSDMYTLYRGYHSIP